MLLSYISFGSGTSSYFNICCTNLKTHTIPSVAAPDPGSGAFLTPGSGVDKENRFPDPG